MSLGCLGIFAILALCSTDRDEDNILKDEAYFAGGAAEALIKKHASYSSVLRRYPAQETPMESSDSHEEAASQSHVKWPALRDGLEDLGHAAADAEHVLSPKETFPTSALLQHGVSESLHSQSGTASAFNFKWSALRDSLEDLGLAAASAQHELSHKEASSSSALLQHGVSESQHSQEGAISAFHSKWSSLRNSLEELGLAAAITENALARQEASPSSALLEHSAIDSQNEASSEFNSKWSTLKDSLEDLGHAAASAEHSLTQREASPASALLQHTASKFFDSHQAAAGVFDSKWSALRESLEDLVHAAARAEHEITHEAALAA